jgi:enoyl-CoA hydratase
VNTEGYSFLRIEQRDGIVFATMDRPERDNAFTPAERKELDRLPADLAAASSSAGGGDVRVLVLTGAGTAFSAGADHSTDPFDPYTYYDRAGKFVRRFLGLDIPVIMALNGPARGLGWTLALTGDILIAERQVIFQDTHVRGGVVSATGPFLWPRSTGLAWAKRYLLTGDSLDAEQAASIGLVTEVVDTGQSLARATEYAERIAALRPSGVQGTKRALNQWLLSPLPEVFDHGLALEFMRFPEDYAASTRGATPPGGP